MHLAPAKSGYSIINAAYRAGSLRDMTICPFSNLVFGVIIPPASKKTGVQGTRALIGVEIFDSLSLPNPCFSLPASPHQLAFDHQTFYLTEPEI
jgi:hypothetical protein